MASLTCVFYLLFSLYFILSLSNSSIAAPNNPTPAPAPTPTPAPPPKPTPWPHQFHSILVMNNTKTLKQQVINLWYDWTNGRNFNIIQKQLGELLYDLEWTNGTSFYYTLDSNKKCKVIKFQVGILKPNWLEGAKYLGQRTIGGFLCNVWTKVNFIWYYEDVVTKRPVHWAFFSGQTAHVMTFEVGAVLEDAKWQAPSYCFNKKGKEDHFELEPEYDSVIEDGVLRGSAQLTKKWL